jgi:hypothetical protein
MMTKVKKLEITANRPLYSAYMEALDARIYISNYSTGIRGMYSRVASRRNPNLSFHIVDSIPSIGNI